MPVSLVRIEVGPWPMNAYLIIDEQTRASAIVDPGAEPEKILAAAEGTRVERILVTHGHADHVGGLEAVKEATHVPIYLHPADAAQFGVPYDVPVGDGDLIPVGNLQVKAHHTPGHTPGMTCYDLGDGRVIVGDTIFVGGPGRTWSAEDFATTLHTMEKIVFTWGDDTIFYPGHGSWGKIGKERLKFEAFMKQGWTAGLQGDVTW